MKKTNKLWLTLLLAVLVASLLAAGLTVSAEETPAYAVGDHIQFGSYPQTRVEETDELSAAAQAATWKSYGYYTGTAAGVWGNDSFNGQMQPGDWMQFADFFCGGEKYRAVKFTQYRPRSTGAVSSAENSWQDENGYEPNTVYYFKYEPLTWRILDPAAGFIVCESLIDAQPFQNTVYGDCQGIDSTTMASDTVTSSIRTWLNIDFCQTAFTATQRAKIQTTALENTCPFGEMYDAAPMNDRVFLLSSGDVLNTKYGFDPLPCTSGDRAKMAQGTDYARCQGLLEGEHNQTDFHTGITYRAVNGRWMLRSPADTIAMIGVDYGGEVDYAPYVNFTDYGTRPACRLSALGDDMTVAETLYSNVVDQGFCGGEDDGKNLVWTLDNAGTLTISGTGAMADEPFNFGEDPSILSVHIEDGVTSIGDSAFSNLIGLNQISIPDSVTSIGDYAFYFCTSLQQITIPDGVTRIGSHTFYWCCAMNSISIPDSVTEIGFVAFEECQNLKELRLPKHLEVIEPGAFERSGLQTVSVPSSVTMIYSSAFSYCNDITDVYYGGSEEEWNAITIEANNDPLLNANIHYNVVDWGYCGGGGTNVVWVLTNDGTLTISGTGSIKGYYYGHRKEDGFYSTAPWWNYHDSIQTLKLEEGITFIGVAAFRGCSSIKAVVIPVSLTRVQEWVFSECDAITDVFYGGDNIQWYGISYYDPGLNKDESLVNGVYGVGSLPRAHIHYNATWHTPGETVIENEVAATCTTAGGYDEVVYCTQCPYEISRNHVTVDPIRHTPGETVRENEVASTCKTAGGYDEVIYCTQCPCEVSRNHVTLALDPDNHEQVAYCEEVLPRPNHVEHGHEAGERCLACGEWLTGEEIHNTDGEWIPLAEATAEDLAGLVVREEDGDYIIICTKCGGRGLYKVENPPEDPTDPTQPTQPDQPDQPDQPGDNGGGENILTSITNGIRKAWNGFIEVFLRLIRWLGGGKK